MIYTCTLNPAIDYKIKLDKLEIGQLNRFEEGQFLVGGKGINVSIALKKLNIPTVITGFIGGITGSRVKSDVKTLYGLKSEFIMVDAMTRVNVKILIGDKETEINHIGTKVSGSSADALLKKISKLTNKDLLVCGGSSINGHPKLYEKIASLCETKQIEFIMDTPGNYYDQFLSKKPLLVKPNIEELEMYFNQKIDEHSVIEKAYKLIALGAKHVLVSLGSKGSILISEDHIYQAKPIKGEVKNTIGAGDSMVAGFIYGIKKKLSLLETYKYAVACATATTFGDEVVDLKVFNQVYDTIEIEVIK